MRNASVQHESVHMDQPQAWRICSPGLRAFSQQSSNTYRRGMLHKMRTALQACVLRQEQQTCVEPARPSTPCTLHRNLTRVTLLKITSVKNALNKKVKTTEAP